MPVLVEAAEDVVVVCMFALSVVVAPSGVGGARRAVVSGEAEAASTVFPMLTAYRTRVRSPSIFGEDATNTLDALWVRVIQARISGIFCTAGTVGAGSFPVAGTAATRVA